MAAHGDKAIRMCLVKIAVNPLLVDGIASAVLREGIHVPCCLLKPCQVLIVVINQDILIVDMVAGQQQPHGRSEAQSAVRAVS